MDAPEVDLYNYCYDQFEEEFPGSFWRYLDYADGSRLILTPEYLNMSEVYQTEMIDLLRDGIVNGCGNYIDYGAEGYVYPCGDRYAVKVVVNPLTLGMGSPEERLVYTELLRTKILPELPRWADVVPNYLRFISSEGVSYTIMPRVAEGITIANLRIFAHGQFDRNSPFVNEKIALLFPGLNHDLCAQIEQQYSTLRILIRRVANKRMSKDNVLNDYKYSNVLVTPYSKRVGGYYYGLSIIDQ